MATDQLGRFRQAVDGAATGEALVTRVAALEGKYTISGRALSTAPRGYPRDHPRIRFLQHKGLTAGREFGTPDWLSTKLAKRRIAETWRGASILNEWLNSYVGPSHLPPTRSADSERVSGRQRELCMTSYTQMVALGSSFAAGPGIEPVADRPAKRSAQNYAHLVAQSLGADLVDATVSGATTATILHSSQRVGRLKFAPQINAVHAGADLVTITAGGNDLGYIGGVLGRAVLHRIERLRLLRPVVRRLGREIPADRRDPRTCAERRGRTGQHR